MPPSDTILEAVQRRLAEGVGARQLERRHGLAPYSLHGLLGKRRKVPSVDRAAEICEALGIDVVLGRPAAAKYVAPEPRASGAPSRTDLSAGLRDLENHARGLVRAVVALGGDPIPPELLATIPLSDVRLSAGSGEPIWSEAEEVDMAVSVARSALAAWARPDRLRCVRAGGNSMNPTIRDGDFVALDVGRTEPLEGQIFGVRVDEGLMVKRMRRIDGRWHLTSDNPDYGASRPIARQDRILGQVAWTGPASKKEGGE